MNTPAMPVSQTWSPSASDRWPVRVWPGVLILVIVGVLRYIPGELWPQSSQHLMSMMGGVLISMLFPLVWWILFARVRGFDRWSFPALWLLPAIPLGTLVFKSNWMILPFSAIPFVFVVWVLWLVATPALSAIVRKNGLAAVILAAWALVALLRFDGLTGHFWPNLRWFWQPSAEEKFLAEHGPANPAAVSKGDAPAIVVGPGDWAEFRGPNRDNRLTGVTIATDWEAKPPKELWRKRVGPGWGSFAVVGDRIFTQEQRGNGEAVVCYAADTGAELWEYHHPDRFEDAQAGAGPRATPTVADGKVFAQGAKGKLVCLDAATGKRYWEVDLVKAVNGHIADWGYAASPLVMQGVVVVYSGGREPEGSEKSDPSQTEEWPNGKGIAAFKADSGELAWSNGRAQHSYCSVQRATLGGTEQLLLTSDFGIEAFRPSDGELLWQVKDDIRGFNRVTQPAIVDDKSVLFGTGIGNKQGVQRLRVSQIGSKWEATPEWKNPRMRPYFNDGVVFNGHYYGFDSNRFCCIELEKGKEKWRTGSTYGTGQVLLLADQALLLILAEDGRVALVEATPNAHHEIANFQALEGKTWNHPVVAHGKLFVRNGEWAACFQLTPK